MDQDTIVKTVQDTVSKGFSEFMEKSLVPTMNEISLKTSRQVVESMLIERAVKGRDISGLDSERKIKFAKQVQSVFRGNRDGALVMKANEALIEEQDNRGGYLVEPEVAAAILRIAASVGTIMKQCQMWPMKTDELGIPNYTGSFLTGSYIGVDVAGTVTGLTFGQAVLIARKWQLAFTVGNDLLADASVQLADWLMAMAGEALANMVDQQGFVGGATLNGSTAGTTTSYAGPFQGLLGIPNVNTYTLAATNTTYAKFNPVTDANNVVATLEESILDGAAWYMHRTVWAAIASELASTSGLPFLFFGAFAANQAGLEKDALGGPIRPAGNMAGFPVYTNRWLPATTVATQANTPFMIFGNMKAAAFGDKGDMRVAQFESGSFGGKEVALTDQRGIVYKHRHAFVIVLPKAFTVVYTAAS
jgi:HK97 family phage major capsid protein